MKRKYLGLYCIFGVIFGAVLVGFDIGLNRAIGSGGIVCTLVCGAILGGIVWDSK